MEHSPSMNVSVVDGDEVEDHQPLLPSRTGPPTQPRAPHCGIHQNAHLSADQTVWLDRTQAMAATPLYNGHLYVQPSPRGKRKGDRVKEKKGERRSGGSKQRQGPNHRGKAKNTGPHRLRERGAAFADIPASPRAAPFRSPRTPAHVSLEMQEHHSLPEIIITSRDDDLQAPPCHQGLAEARGLLPGAEQSPDHGPRPPPPPPPPPGPKSKTGDKDEAYWKSHSIGWRLLHRRALFLRRQRLNDCALAVAIFGVVMMVLETELSWSWYSKSSIYSLAIKSVISLSTVTLLGLLIAYHCCEVQLYVHDIGAEDWRIAMTTDRLALVAVELAAVAIHPYPVGLVSYFQQSLRHAAPQLLLSETELEIILALPMFLRFYLLGRAMMLHSRLFTDTASRSIGALNKIKIAAANVLRETWLIYKHTKLSRERDVSRVRTHQRKLLLAIHQLRRMKMEKRTFADQSNSLVDLGKMQSLVYDVLSEVQDCRGELDSHIDTLEKKVEELREGFRSLLPLLSSTLSTQNSSIRHLLREREGKTEAQRDKALED